MHTRSTGASLATAGPPPSRSEGSGFRASRARSARPSPGRRRRASRASRAPAPARPRSASRRRRAGRAPCAARAPRASESSGPLERRRSSSFLGDVLLARRPGARAPRAAPRRWARCPRPRRSRRARPRGAARARPLAACLGDDLLLGLAGDLQVGLLRDALVRRASGPSGPTARARAPRRARRARRRWRRRRRRRARPRGTRPRSARSRPPTSRSRMSSRSSSSVSKPGLGGEVVVELGQVLGLDLLDGDGELGLAGRPAPRRRSRRGRSTSTVRSSPALAPSSCSSKPGTSRPEPSSTIWSRPSPPWNGVAVDRADEVHHDEVAARRRRGRRSPAAHALAQALELGVDRLVGDVGLAARRPRGPCSRRASPSGARRSRSRSVSGSPSPGRSPRSRSGSPTGTMPAPSIAAEYQPGERARARPRRAPRRGRRAG